jgi:hypothetical protein
MAASAAFLGVIGLLATFLPAEILAAAGVEPFADVGFARLLVQLLGAAALGSAMLNWMGRTNLIGGIYSRPVALGNALHFTMGALALLKGVAAGATSAPAVALFVCYSIFAAAFNIVLFRHPAPRA